MSQRIKRGPFPPGGFQFTDPKTGYRFDGLSADLNRQARMVIAHRLSNSLHYPSEKAEAFSMVAVIQEITDQVCAKHPSYCSESGTIEVNRLNSNIAQPKSVTMATACLKCGGLDFDPILCPTCGGHRVTGFKCKTCGTERKK